LGAAARAAALGVSIGCAEDGRSQGDPLLVRWLGRIAGSRDTGAPDGDRRFFREKLKELPSTLAAEARARNTHYLSRLAERLVG
jgi:hypothetical protein